MKKFLTSMLEDNSGGISYSRVNCLIWTLSVLLIWLVASSISITTKYKINKTQLELLKNNPSLTVLTNTNPVDNKIVNPIIIDNSNYLPTLPDWVVAVLLGFHGYKAVQRFSEKPEIELTELTSTSNNPPKI